MWQQNLALGMSLAAAGAVGAAGMYTLITPEGNVLTYAPTASIEDITSGELTGNVAGSLVATNAGEQHVSNFSAVDARGDIAGSTYVCDDVTKSIDFSEIDGIQVNGLGTVSFEDGETADNSLLSQTTARLSPNTILSEYETAYPTGTIWTNNFYYKNLNQDVYRGGYGCAGFAYMLSDSIFGNAHTIVTTDCNEVVPYCVAEVYNGDHTVFVLNVDYENRTICVAEANVEQKVCWGNVYSFDDISLVLLRQ